MCGAQDDGMISAHIAGNLIIDPICGITENNTPLTRFVLACDTDNYEKPLTITGIAFGPHSEPIKKLKAGDALSVVGALKLSEYTGKDGEKHSGLQVTVTRCLI